MLRVRGTDARRIRATLRRRPRARGCAVGDRSLSEPVELCGVALRGPVLNGSGTFDAIAARQGFGDALLEEFPLYAFVSKTITLAPRQGNPPPRLWETPAGMINSIGLPNRGLEGFLAEDLPQLAELPVPLVVSVMGFSRDELAALVARVGEREEVAMIELNVSCPNVETGLVMGADPDETARALERVRPHTEKPLIVKLTPNALEPAAVAAAAEDAGADAVSLINTLKGMALHPRTRKPWLGGITGGLSGPAVRAGGLGQGDAVGGRGGRPAGGRRGPSGWRFRRSAWAGSPAGATRGTSSPPARHASRWGRRTSATPRQAGGGPQSFRSSAPPRQRPDPPFGTAADPSGPPRVTFFTETAGSSGGALRTRIGRLRKGLQTKGKRSRYPNQYQAQVEVYGNSLLFRVSRLDGRP